MISRFLYFSLLVWALSAFQVQAREVTKEVTINSKIAQQALTFHITLPSNYQSDGTSRYPVFYTTSGNSRLNMLKAQVDWLSHVGFAPLPQLFIVSLPSVEADKFTKASGSLDTLVTQVYEKEIIPYIDKHYRTQPYRIIEGFSSTANLLLSIFLEKPQLFNAYLIFSPSFGLDKSNLVTRLLAKVPDKDYRYRSLYLSLGSFKDNKAPFEQVQKHLASWSNEGITGLDIITEDLSKKNYLSAPVIGLANAAEIIFSDRQADASLFEKTGISGVKQHFRELHHKYGYELSADSTIVDLSFYYAEIKQFEKAETTLNTLITKAPNNIIFRVRLSEIQQKANQIESAKHTLTTALIHANTQKDAEAISYIESRLIALK